MAKGTLLVSWGPVSGTGKAFYAKRYRIARLGSIYRLMLGPVVFMYLPVEIDELLHGFATHMRGSSTP